MRLDGVSDGIVTGGVSIVIRPWSGFGTGSGCAGGAGVALRGSPDGSSLGETAGGGSSAGLQVTGCGTGGFWGAAEAAGGWLKQSSRTASIASAIITGIAKCRFISPPG